MNQVAAALALAEAATRRRRVNEFVRGQLAFPLRLLALAWIVLIPVVALVGRNHLGPFVGLALLVVTVLAWRQYRLTAREHGVRARLWPWMAIAVVGLVGGVATSRGGTDHDIAWLNTAGPFCVNAAALLCLAWLVGSRPLACCVGVMGVISAASAGLLAGDAAVGLELAGYAAALLVAAGRMSQ